MVAGKIKKGNRVVYINPGKIAVSDKTNKTIVPPTGVKTFDDVVDVLSKINNRN